jgi:hypothetical protein
MSPSPLTLDLGDCGLRIGQGINLQVEKAEVLHSTDKPSCVSDRFLPPGQLCWMAEGRCVGEFPQNVIRDQRLPLRIIVDKRLDMLLSEIGSDRHARVFVCQRVSSS